MDLQRERRHGGSSSSNNSNSSSSSSISSSSGDDGGGGGGTSNTTSNATSHHPPLLVSFGNPLLDITAVVRDSSLHERFQLPVDGQLEVNEEQRPVFSHVMKEYPVEYTAGGCALNSSRVFCWVLGEAQRVVFVGGIGQDEAAQRLSSIVQESGVITRFVVVEDQPTGVCVALVLGACRCLCADIGAAATCLPQHVFTPQLLPVLEEARFIYVEGYFITHSFPAALQIAQYAQRKHKTLVFNLCGSYVCENNSEELRHLLPYVDILFGFVEEYRTLDHFVNVEELSANLSDSPGNICHDLLLVLRAMRGEEQVLADTVKAKQHLDFSSSSPSSPHNHNTTATQHHNQDTTNSYSSYSFSEPVMNGPVTLTDGPEALIDGTDTPDIMRCYTDGHTVPNSLSDMQDKLQDTPSTPAVTLNSHSVAPDSHSSTPVSSNSHSPSHHGESNGSLPNGMLGHAANGSPRPAPCDDSDGGGSGSKQKVVVVTKGPSPLLYSHRGVVRQRPVPPISPEDIVDTTGAGDSFVGGFLAALSRGFPLDRCLDCGVWTAQHLLRQKGCTLPLYPAEFLALD